MEFHSFESQRHVEQEKSSVEVHNLALSLLINLLSVNRTGSAVTTCVAANS